MSFSTMHLREARPCDFTLFLAGNAELGECLGSTQPSSRVDTRASSGLVDGYPELSSEAIIVVVKLATQLNLA